MTFHDGLNLILLLCGLLVFYRIIKGTQQLEFWHLISVTSADGHVWTDNDKVGQVTGLVFSTWVIGYLTLSVKTIDGYFVLCLAAWLLYCAGMTAFGKFARAFIMDRYGSRGKEPEKPDPPGTLSATTPAGGTMKMTP